MIALLRGVVSHLEAGRVVLEVGGVGYLVRVPVGARLAGVGQELTLHTHLSVREDALDLYGFVSTDDRDLFTTLLSTNGIGPKTALAAIDTLGADGIRAAVIADDPGSLTAIPGVGRKGAARMILELRGKIGALPEGDPTAAHGALSNGGSPRSDAREALGALGYAAAEIEHALRAAPADAPAEEQIRMALKGLA